jgi:hypothetical protein
MKLVSAQIRNYGNVVNSKEFEIENVTCLTGRNIEGKTNTLKALTKLNPADPLDGNFFDQRMPGGQLGELNDRPENILQTRWHLMQEDIRAVEKYLGRQCLTSEITTLRKGYKNELQWDLPIDFDRYRSESPADVSGRDYTARFFEPGDPSRLNGGPRLPAAKLQPEKLVLTDYQINRSRARMTGKDILERRLPRFLYAAVYDIIASDASMLALVRKKETDSCTTGEKILLEWLALAGTSPEQLLASGDIEGVTARLNEQAENFCRKIFQYWPHYSQLQFDISFRPVVPAETATHSVDQQFRIRVKNRRSGLPESIDSSRSGFLWFFSFLIRYHKAACAYSENLILVLDEPGLTEAARPQAALLTYFSRELTPRHQLIYSTHLPAMIDPTLF